MPELSMKEFLEAGVHFGHQRGRWNPKMKPYIFDVRDDVHIIDLQKTVDLCRDACNFVRSLVAEGQKVLFVGTKKQAQQIVQDEATRAKMFYVTHRWLGGTLTNFKTIRMGVNNLKRIEDMEAKGLFDVLPKKEVAALKKERQKLLSGLSGIREMKKLPGALFILDPGKEDIAVQEANKLKIPVVAVVDTNCNPDNISYVIPGNDDAIKSIRLFSSLIASACLEGVQEYEQKLREEGVQIEEEEPKVSATDVLSVGETLVPVDPTKYEEKPTPESEGETEPGDTPGDTPEDTEDKEPA